MRRVEHLRDLDEALELTLVPTAARALVRAQRPPLPDGERARVRDLEDVREVGERRGEGALLRLVGHAALEEQDRPERVVVGVALDALRRDRVPAEVELEVERV